MQRIGVFCGSTPGHRPVYQQAARELGALVAGSGYELVYGGGHVGLMGVLADAVLEHGGQVTGVMTQHLVDREIAHHGLTELRVVHSMHERKAVMADLADAFIALPGGYGTYEEFFEVLTWGQLGLHRKPCGLLNVAGFYDALLRMFEHAMGEGFVHAGNRALVVDDSDPQQLLQRLAAYQPPSVTKGIQRDET